MSQDHWLTPNEVAEMLLVSPVTVRQWAQKGLLDHRTTPGGHRRFALEVVRRFAQKSGFAGRLIGSVRRVLVADEDAQLNRFVVALLQERNSDTAVDGVTDAFEAGRRLEATQPHVFVFDPMMNGLDAFSLCRRLRAESKAQEIRLVAMTNAFTAENGQRLVDAGADACLEKPFTSDALIRAVGLATQDG